MGLYTRAIRPALFRLDAERAHELTLAALRRPALRQAVRWLPRPPRDERLRQQVFGLEFTHPVGLGAGLDKQGTALPAWADVGFSFVEVGTVTPAPQPGNPRPRLFRLPADRAIINRFGFNSVGAEGVARNVASARPPSLRVGMNLGKNKDTPNARAAEDYVRAVETLHAVAEYFVVNVSSPNTAQLRDLQEAESLRSLVRQVTHRVAAVSPARFIPVLVKVSPDAAPSELLRSVDAALEGGASGVIATNTTTTRTGLRTSPPLAGEAGGLSGAPLRHSANAACRLLFGHLGRRIPIIGVGGIFTAADVYERIRSGASLVQIYTALVYCGPGIVAELVGGLSDCLTRDGFGTISEVIGIDVR